ncbi:protein SMALL AUXIN UP-REGULATED RNA 12-like [Nymphaea colorata]|uniref:Uncharacterized protein n=1 Tax=Nymphaea colorata TaxID=210225 RepID=A0A5K1H460_9MAGN|nr:protein SMALL AUXIN UP-REGULATED RNA 12-like [Nymphaea colorata]
MGKRWQMPTMAVKYGTREKEPVAKGHIAIYAGKDGSRFVVPLSYLRHPIFRCLLNMAEEEFGFSQQGGLTIPCEASFLRKSIDQVRGKLAPQEYCSCAELLQIGFR